MRPSPTLQIQILFKIDGASAALMMAASTRTQARQPKAVAISKVGKGGLQKEARAIVSPIYPTLDSSMSRFQPMRQVAPDQVLQFHNIFAVLFRQPGANFGIERQGRRKVKF